MGLRSWRRRPQLFKVVELLGGGLGVTRTATEPGYDSTPIYAFRADMGYCPQACIHAGVADRLGRA